MTTYYDYLDEVERRRDDIATAERERMARQVSRSGAPRRARVNRWLVALGGLLVVWGCRLQTRFGSGLAVSGALQTDPGLQDSNASPCAG
jgi:hypothetical protein